MIQRLNGIPSSPGMYLGRAVVINSEAVIITNGSINEKQIPEEISKFESAVAEVSLEYNETLAIIDKKQKNISSIVETGLLLVQDPIMKEEIIRNISSGTTVESAIVNYLDTQKHFFMSSKDTLLRDRAVDIDNLKERLLSSIRHKNISYNVGKDSIIIVKSLSTTDFIKYCEAGIKGIVTEIGGITSHCSILARSFEIPAVIGVRTATSQIKDGCEILINGFAGSVILNPDAATISAYQLKKAIEEEHAKRLSVLRNLKTETLDGHKIKLLSTINTETDIETAARVKSDGVGLVRTEGLILSLHRFPDEETQTGYYSRMADAVYPENIIFRAFDIGSDKYSEGIPFHESNPALGLRGMRFLLRRRDILKTQIRAVLRSSGNKNVKFMLPMITGVQEIIEAKAIIEECKNELSAESAAFDDKMPFGIMIETPSAAVLSKNLAELVDFFSIGSNDLTQYTLAADRTNELVLDYFNAFHPAVLRLIKLIADSANTAGIEVGICGEIAGHIAATPLLIGFGINELSVSPTIHLEMKKRIRRINYSYAESLAEKVLSCSSQAEVRKIILDEDIQY